MSFCNKLISVIIPVYNAEETLEECIESILHQTYINFEVILVDDGSTDSSWSICKELQKRDVRIKIIHISNKGIFQARKVGTSISQGEYLTFLDADDWIEKDAFEFAINIISSHQDIDFLTYAYRYNSDGLLEENLYNEGIYCGDEIKKIIQQGMMFDSMIGKRRMNPSLCTKFIRKGLYQSIADDIDDYISLGEDALISYTAICKANKIGIFNEPFYHYRINEKSCTHTFPVERIAQISDFRRNMREQIEKTGYLPILEKQIDSYVRSFLRTMIRSWFDMDYSDLPYIFPTKKYLVGTKVAIYGAGTVGMAYIKELLFSHCAELVAWVDKGYASKCEYMGIPVESVDKLKEKEFDYLIIAICDENVALEIRDSLINNVGVPGRKIIWEAPVFVG